MSKAKVVAVIDGVELSGLTKDEAFKILMVDNSLPHSEAARYYTAHGDKQHRGGIFQATLDYLSESDRTQSEFVEFILKNGSKNEARWFSHRDAVRLVTIKVRNNPKFQDVPMTSKQKEALEARYK